MQIASYNPQFPNQKIGFKGVYSVNIGAGNNKEEGGFNVTVNNQSLGIQALDTISNFTSTVAGVLKGIITKDQTPPSKFYMTLPGGMGSDSKGQYASIPNIIGSNGKKPVGKTYIKPIGDEIKKTNPNATLTVVNDGMLQAYQDIRDPDIRKFLNDNLSEGESYICRFGGGGCGGYRGTKTANGFLLTPEEIGHLPMYKNEINSKYVDNVNDLHTIESYAGCVPAATRVFALELGFSKEDAQKLAQAVEGRILSCDTVELDAKDAEQSKQADALKATGLFESSQEGNIRKFKLKDPKTGKPITTKERINALKAAAEEYYKSMGVMLADGATHLTHTMILTSGFDRHLSKAAREEAKLNPEQIIKETAFRNVDDSIKQALDNSPNSFKVKIKDTGDPSDLENIKLMDKGEVIGGFRIGVVPKNAFPIKIPKFDRKA